MAAAPGRASPSDAAGREFEFTAEDFGRVRELIHRHAGIALADGKQSMVYGRLARRVRALGLKRFSEYLSRVEQGSPAEVQSFVNALTTNLTSFFREAHHFGALASLLRAQRDERELRLWCAAAATGEEAWSMAISACEAFDSLAPPVRILASDIDTTVIERAQRAEYGEESVRALDPARLRRFFEPAGARWSVRAELRRLVSFRQINLLAAAWPALPQQHAIFCRNVMIYFDKATQRRVIERFAPLLTARGRLFIGHSESLGHARDLFQLEGRTVYRRAESGESPLAANPAPIAPDPAAESVFPSAVDRVIVVGASTGGTDALRDFLAGMPRGSPPVLIAQHMPGAFTRAFAERLSAVCRIAVRQAGGGEPLQAGTAYLAPGDRHLLVRRHGSGWITVLDDRPPVNQYRPSVELLFRSAAEQIGAKAIGVMLTGMGKDGAAAMLEMRHAGAWNIAQDEASCVVFGMPREAIALGAVHQVLPLGAIAAAVAAVSRTTVENPRPV